MLLRKTVVKGQTCELMSEVLPIVYLARHGETAWTVSGQHTGLTDLPLTKRGERNARRLEERLRGVTFAKVFTSPLQRATRTCELAGFGAMVKSTGTCSNGTMASMRVALLLTSTKNVPIGSCFAMAALEENRQVGLACGRIAR